MVMIEERSPTVRDDEPRAARWSLVALGVSLIVVLAVAVAWWALDKPENESTVAEPPSSGEDYASSWSVSSLLPAIDPTWSLATHGDTAVAVGPGPGGDALTLFSHDGVEWEPSVGFTREGEAGRGSGIHVVGVDGFQLAAAGPRGFVALAEEEHSPLQRGPREPVLAFSPDGATWSLADLGELPTDEVLFMCSVVAGPDGFLAVGVRNDDPTFSAVAWHSADGRTWVDTDLSGLEAPLAVAHDGSRWVALGFRDPMAGRSATVLTSIDGVRWAEIDASNPPPVEAVSTYVGTSPFVARDGTLLLIPGESRAMPDAWRSTDGGRSWEAHTISDDPRLQSTTLVRDVVRTESGYLAVALVESRRVRPGRDEAPVVLFSEDGVDWTVHRSPADLHDVEQLGDDLIAVDGDGIVFGWSSDGVG